MTGKTIGQIFADNPLASLTDNDQFIVRDPEESSNAKTKVVTAANLAAYVGEELGLSGSSQPLDGDLTAIAGLSGSGLIARTGDGTAALRTVTGTANEITVTDGTGASGNPTISLPTALTFSGKTVTGGTFSGPTLTGISGFTALDTGLIVQDDGDNTKQFRFEASSITAGQTRVLTVQDTNGTIAVTGNKLSVFAATTSSELAGVISDETGSGALVFATSPGFTTAANPVSNDGAALGTTTLGWSDLHLATGALVNVANGNAVITHSSGIFTVSTGDLRVTTAGTNSASAVTVAGTQTLTNKTLTSPSLTSPTITTSPTAAGATWTDLGTVTTADINGGTVDGTVIGGASSAAGTFTTMTATTGAITSIELGHASDTTIARSSAGVITVEGNTVWHAGNDGSGSGLDADLLDGKNTGTSGNVVPLLDGTNTWSGQQTITLGSAAATEPLRLVNTTDNASVQVAQLEGDRATMADNDEAYVSLLLSNDGGTQTEFARLTWVAADVNAGTSEDGQFEIDVVVAGSLTQIAAISGTGLNLAASKALSFGGVSILSDSAGTTTLSNIDALDATTESAIEDAIDTLANLTSVQGQTVTLSDAGFDVLFGWDDSGAAYKNFLLADIATEGGPAAGDFVLLYGAEGDLRKVNWSSLPGAGGGLTNVADDTDPALGGNLDANTFSILFDDNTGIYDQNGNEVLVFQTVASAVNYVDLFDAATGTNPKFAGTGSDTDVGIDFAVKAAGKFNFLATTSGPAEIRLFEDADNGSNYAGIIAPSSLGSDITLTLPSATGTFATLDGTETLTAKTLTAPKIANAGFLADANGNELVIFTTTASAVNEWTLANGVTGVNPTLTASGEANVGLNFQVKGTGVYRFLATTSGPAEIRLFEDADNGSNYAGIIAPASLGSDITLTLPSATGTFATLAGTETLSGKTLTAAKIANAGFLADANGNELIIFTTTASAVNEWTFANGATGVNPKLTASGETNVGLDFQVKGTGTYRFLATASGPTDIRWFEDTDNGTSYVSLIAPSALSADFVSTLPAGTGTLLSTGVTATLTKGFNVTAPDLGNITSFTVDPTTGNLQYGTNHGAATWTAPASDCAVDILVTNDASAGTITFSGFTVGSGTGDALTTTNTSKFLVMIRRINSVATYHIKALQ